MRTRGGLLLRFRGEEEEGLCRSLDEILEDGVVLLLFMFIICGWLRLIHMRGRPQLVSDGQLL